jgi:hypothetical protein
MPFYWWRYVNPNFSQTYDQSYVEQMFEMLPYWIKCIVINKVRSSSSGDEQSRGDGGATNTSLLYNYTNAVNKVQPVVHKTEDLVGTPSETDTAAETRRDAPPSDGILHTCSSAVAHGISFTTCGGYDRSQSKSYRVPVPHLARLSVLHHQWPTLPAPGRIVSMVYVLASYSNSNCGFKDPALENKSGPITEVEEDVDRPSVIDRYPYHVRG